MLVKIQGPLLLHIFKDISRIWQFLKVFSRPVQTMPQLGKLQIDLSLLTKSPVFPTMLYIVPGNKTSLNSENVSLNLPTSIPVAFAQGPPEDDL